MDLRKVRDLSLIKLDNSSSIVIACDSCGAIGMKEGDVLKVPASYVGRFTARVAMMEVLCAGAEVVTITNNVCNEMQPTGMEVIKGIKEELASAGLEETVLTGSTEENFKTISTAVGITVIGAAEHQKLRVNNVKSDAIVICAGLPKVGDEIDYVMDKEIVSYSVIKELLSCSEVYEIVPVGSKGIAYECTQLAEGNKLVMDFKAIQQVDIFKSGGPATCVVAAVKPEAIDYITSKLPNINIIGRVKKDA